MDRDFRTTRSPNVIEQLEVEVRVRASRASILPRDAVAAAVPGQRRSAARAREPGRDRAFVRGRRLQTLEVDLLIGAAEVVTGGSPFASGPYGGWRILLTGTERVV